LSEESRLATLPAVNARIRNSSRRNIGSVTLVSMTAKTPSTTTPTATSVRTFRLAPRKMDASRVLRARFSGNVT
jgi:hypothetical protein